MWRRIGVLGHSPDGDTNSDRFQQLRRRTWCGGCKALSSVPHVPGRVRAGFVEVMTFALGPADSFQAEKDGEGIHTEAGAEVKAREGEGSSCLGSGESLVQRAQATPRWSVRWGKSGTVPVKRCTHKLGGI